MIETVKTDTDKDWLMKTKFCKSTDYIFCPVVETIKIDVTYIVHASNMTLCHKCKLQRELSKNIICLCKYCATYMHDMYLSYMVSWKCSGWIHSTSKLVHSFNNNLLIKIKIPELVFIHKKWVYV